MITHPEHPHRHSVPAEHRCLTAKEAADHLDCRDIATGKREEVSAKIDQCPLCRNVMLDLVCPVRAQPLSWMIFSFLR